MYGSPTVANPDGESGGGGGMQAGRPYPTPSWGRAIAKH